MKRILTHAEKVLTKHPVGSSRKTLGSIGYYFEQGFCDGVAVVNAWGCDHGQLAEGFLRHQAEVPMMHLYLDGVLIGTRGASGSTNVCGGRTPKMTYAGGGGMADGDGHILFFDQIFNYLRVNRIQA